MEPCTPLLDWARQLAGGAEALEAGSRKPSAASSKVLCSGWDASTRPAGPLQTFARFQLGGLVPTLGTLQYAASNRALAPLLQSPSP